MRHIKDDQGCIFTFPLEILSLFLLILSFHTNSSGSEAFSSVVEVCISKAETSSNQHKFEAPVSRMNLPLQPFTFTSSIKCWVAVSSKGMHLNPFLPLFFLDLPFEYFCHKFKGLFLNHLVSTNNSNRPQHRNMNIVDTHTHLYSSQFEEDRDEVVQRAIANGVDVYIPAIDSSYTQKMFDLEKKYPENVYLMMGLHPTYVKENGRRISSCKGMDRQTPFLCHRKIELTVLDKTYLKEQQHAFRTQIQWAKEKLPINIHCRCF